MELKRVIISPKTQTDDQSLDTLYGLVKRRKFTVHGRITQGLIADASASDIKFLEKNGMRVEVLEDPYIVHAGEFRFDCRGKERILPASLDVPAAKRNSRCSYIIQLIGPLQEEWREILAGENIEIRDIAGTYSLYVEASREAIETADNLSFVAWTGLFQPR